MLVIIDNYTTLQVLKPASRKTLGVLLCFISLCQVLFSSALTTFITHLISVKNVKIHLYNGAHVEPENQIFLCLGGAIVVIFSEFC